MEFSFQIEMEIESVLSFWEGGGLNTNEDLRVSRIIIMTQFSKLVTQYILGH